MAKQPAYTPLAVDVIARAARAEHDFPGWLAGILASVAARLGSSYALVEGRPGSWEADLVEKLVRGTVGWEDEGLHDYGEPSPPRPADERYVPPGFELAAVPDTEWRLVTGKVCRFRSAWRGPACGRPSAAEFLRGWNRPAWWAYCEQHLYGRWIEDGQVMQWIMREKR